jgi:hypothetical protein
MALDPRHIETKGALNDWEQENILQATKWLRRAKIADVLLKQLGQPLFSWGSGANVVSANVVRTRYLGALRVADRGDFADLLAFVRS